MTEISVKIKLERASRDRPDFQYFFPCCFEDLKKKIVDLLINKVDLVSIMNNNRLGSKFQNL